jgi:hypothetical protein
VAPWLSPPSRALRLFFQSQPRILAGTGSASSAADDDDDDDGDGCGGASPSARANLAARLQLSRVKDRHGTVRDKRLYRGRT